MSYFSVWLAFDTSKVITNEYVFYVQELVEPVISYLPIDSFNTHFLESLVDIKPINTIKSYTVFFSNEDVVVR